MRKSSDMRLTNRRREWKALLPPDLAESLLARIQGQFQAAAPEESTVTSVYFDTVDGRLSRAALASPGESLKVRTREYSPDWDAPPVPRCALELKRRLGEVTHKSRFWIARPSLPAVFGRSQTGPADPRPGAAREALRLACGEWRLRPLVAITYRRRVLQVSATLRMTFDREIAFHEAPGALVFGAAPLSPRSLPAPFAVEPRTIVELKTLTSRLPEWAKGLFGGRPGGFSKLTAALQGRPEAQTYA